MKDELGGKIMTKFVGLKAKMMGKKIKKQNAEKSVSWKEKSERKNCLWKLFRKKSTSELKKLSRKK